MKIENRLVLPQGTCEPVILVAEDQMNDVLLLRLAMERAGLKNPLFDVPDGMQAVEYLSGIGRYCDRLTHPLPRLLLLDLKMPRLDGFGVLEWLQNGPKFKQMAKVVLSSSNLEADIDRAEKLGADDFLIKPNNHSDLVDLVIALRNRWLLGVANAPACPVCFGV